MTRLTRLGEYSSVVFVRGELFVDGRGRSRGGGIFKEPLLVCGVAGFCERSIACPYAVDVDFYY